MIEKKKVLCLIPARGGSTGVPGKNLALINGESLTRRAVRCANETSIFTDVLISTDDPKIKDEAVGEGAIAPFMRPKELATNQSHVIDTVHHSLLEMEGLGKTYDYVVLLEPTSPLRTVEIVKSIVNAVITANVESGQTLSLVPDNYRPMKQMVLRSDGRTEDVLPMKEGIYRRQDLPLSYIRNGMVYVVSADCIQNKNKIIGDVNIGRVVDGPAVNIDWPEDLEYARTIIESRENENT